MLDRILERIDKVSSNKKIDILAVTKTRTLEEIQTIIASGITLVGENRVQEAQQKFPFLDQNISKHLIGPLQSNKENKALELFDVIQSIESLEQLQRLSLKLEKKQQTKKVFIQFNTALEDTKHGLKQQEQSYPMIEFILDSSHLILEGIMTIGAMSNQEKIVRQSFAQLACIKENIIVKYPKLNNLKLSMGMSNDFEWAIQEGADIIRLGTILFQKY